MLSRPEPPAQPGRPWHGRAGWPGRSRLTVWLELLFPSRCVGCQRRGHWLCPSCRTGLLPLPRPHCPRCGGGVDRPGPCHPCRRQPPAFDRAWAAYQYTGPLRLAIHRLKYDGQRSLAGPLAELLLTAIPLAAAASDLVVPVPLHPTRRRQRGYNQSELLARAIGEALRRPVVTALHRHRPAEPQVGLPQAARRVNVADAFRWHGPSLAGRRVLLVDDVITTGATLDACAAALRSGGPHSIVAVTLARGVKRPPEP